MNRFVQKLIAGAAAVAIAVTGLLGGAPVAKAAEPVQPTDGTITITNVAGDTAEHTLSGWKLASLRNVSSDNGQLNFLIDTNNDMVSVIEDSMTKDQLDKYHNDANYYSEGDPENNPIGWLVANEFKGSRESEDPWGDTSALRTFATKLSKELAKDGATTASPTQFKSAEKGHDNTCEQGLWFLKDTTGDSTTQSIPIIVATKLAEYTAETVNWGSVTLKMNVPTVDKKIASSVTGTVAEGGSKADARIGGKVEYELSSVIPTYTGYDISNPPRVFKLIDTASVGLTVTDDSVKSVILKKPGTDDVVKLDKDVDYIVRKVKYTGEKADYKDGTVTTIDLEKYVNMADGSKSKANGKILEGYTVVVEFEATVNEGAVITSVGNPNSVELEYSRTPDNEFTTIPGPEVRVYTYDFGILKTDMAGNAIKSTKDLKGAQFVIARVNGNAQTFMAKDATSGVWSDLKAKPDVDANTGVFTTDADGNISMKGLPTGTYRVYEIKAPTGYTNIGLPNFTFTIGSDIDPSSNIAKVTYTKTSDTDGNRVSFGNDKTASTATVKNAKNLTELPLTGDLGIKVFITVGVLLMAAGAAFALSARMRA